jgi:hypothetical protein
VEAIGRNRPGFWLNCAWNALIVLLCSVTVAAVIYLASRAQGYDRFIRGVRHSHAGQEAALRLIALQLGIPAERIDAAFATPDPPIVP